MEAPASDGSNTSLTRREILALPPPALSVRRAGLPPRRPVS
jgi:hypothetical protein